MQHCYSFKRGAQHAHAMSCCGEMRLDFTGVNQSRLEHWLKRFKSPQDSIAHAAVCCANIFASNMASCVVVLLNLHPLRVGIAAPFLERGLVCLWALWALHTITPQASMIHGDIILQRHSCPFFCVPCIALLCSLLCSFAYTTLGFQRAKRVSVAACCTFPR